MGVKWIRQIERSLKVKHETQQSQTTLTGNNSLTISARADNARTGKVVSLNQATEALAA